VTFSNFLFLLVFIVLGTALALSFASLRFANYRVARRLGRPAQAVWRPFWMQPAR
jgi:hypothetical protein